MPKLYDTIPAHVLVGKSAYQKAVEKLAKDYKATHKALKEAEAEEAVMRENAACTENERL
jgi:hypothetical protein